MIPQFKETLDLMNKIHEVKNKDYAKDADPYLNFKHCEAIGLCSVETGILVRMTDKMSRIANLLNKEAAVNDESIQDTLIDLANYAVILKCYIDTKRRLQ